MLECRSGVIQPMYYKTIHDILELLYFGAGIGIAIFAGLGLRQIKIASDQLRLTKEIVEANKKRESVKLAAEQCRYYAEAVVPANSKLGAECHRVQTHAFDPQKQTHRPQPLFTVLDGEIKQVNWDLAILQADWMKIGDLTVEFLNKAECFAIPFAAGVADDSIGYQETAAAFCAQVNALLPAIWHLKQTQNVNYKSILTLFGIWNNRLTADRIAPAYKGMQQLIQAVDREKDKIKLI